MKYWVTCLVRFKVIVRAINMVKAIIVHSKVGNLSCEIPGAKQTVFSDPSPIKIEPPAHHNVHIRGTVVGTFSKIEYNWPYFEADFIWIGLWIHEQK